MYPKRCRFKSDAEISSQRSGKNHLEFRFHVGLCAGLRVLRGPSASTASGGGAGGAVRRNRAGGARLLPSRQPHSATLGIELACHISPGKEKASTAENSWKITKKAIEGQGGSVPSQGCAQTIAGTGLESRPPAFRALSPGSVGRGSSSAHCSQS